MNDPSPNTPSHPLELRKIERNAPNAPKPINREAKSYEIAELRNQLATDMTAAQLNFSTLYGLLVERGIFTAEEFAAKLDANKDKIDAGKALERERRAAMGNRAKRREFLRGIGR